MPPKPRRKAPAAAKGHKLPEPIPEGTEVTDTFKKSWKIGPKIGSGGFGTVYFGMHFKNIPYVKCIENIFSVLFLRGQIKKDYDYVVKVEYHDNGPLFAEMHCYHSIGKPAQLAEWVKKKKLTYLGLSPCYGFGSFEYNNSKYRFMIIERFDKDLQKLFEENGKRFPLKVVYQIGLSLLNVLEYIHTAGYIHGVVLVDMGLAANIYEMVYIKRRCQIQRKLIMALQNSLAEMPIEDVSLDVVILKYVPTITEWHREVTRGKIKGKDKKLQQEKERYMQDIDGFLAELFGDENCPVGIKKLLTYICKLSFEEEPDYNFCRKALRDELKRMGCENDTVFRFQTFKQS
ncbi:Nucleosomal histone kinase 1 like protein [Argiope bruennichi]|uniref:Nucleosomal histone kinase 1 like protein n=1 Tax=Argiope bruennichi TaxID=94029 RepID=A0A8T0FRR1_ARGBR|nr:Nucleosomal histone kinase 1 like protein [Argiope bruennichi]